MSRIRIKKSECLGTTPELENSLREKGYLSVAGVDEAGMSPIAGPVYSAVVILDPDQPIKGLNDSKLLSAEVREELYHEIISRAISYGVAAATVGTINKQNVFRASQIAMKTAMRKLNLKPDFLLIDGNKKLHTRIPQMAIVRGDSAHDCIAAASIIAKVTRDRHMKRLHEKHPEYRWDSNKGYPSPAHRKAIHDYGITELHRLNFKGVIKQGNWKQYQGLGE
jgi:ribonuclease HII